MFTPWKQAKTAHQCVPSSEDPKKTPESVSYRGGSRGVLHFTPRQENLTCDLGLCCEKNLPKPQPEAVAVTPLRVWREGSDSVCSPCQAWGSGRPRAFVKAFKGPSLLVILSGGWPKAWLQEDMAWFPFCGPQVPEEGLPIHQLLCSPCQIQSRRERGQCRMFWIFDRTWKKPCPASEAPR